MEPILQRENNMNNQIYRIFKKISLKGELESVIQLNGNPKPL